MAGQPGVWGIDLGQCGLKAIRLQEIDGQLVATAFDYVEHPKILSQPDADPDQLTREALDKFLERNSLRGDVVAISVPGQSGLARFVKLPPVEEKKIADIVKFEAKQQIPFNLDEVVWDFQKLGSGMVTDGFALETEIGLFAMKRDMVGRYLQHFRDVGVDIHLVQMAPLALCNFVAYDLLGKDPVPEGGGGEESGKKTSIVALDIGADASNLVITDGEKIIWQRPIPLGGNHFTRALTKDLKLTFAKAEHLKRNATKSPDLKKILAALKPVLNDFVGEVQRSLGYFTNTHRDAQIEYMIGLGNAFRLPGLQKFLGEKLSLDVRKLGKMERLSGDGVVSAQVYTENILTFAVAYGLALQGIKRARLLTNLLPPEIRVERLVKAKKPWAAAAAAALLLGSGAMAFSYYLEDRTYGDARVVNAGKAANDAAKRAADAETQFQQTKKAALDEEEAVKTIIAGQPERDNWLQIVKFVNAAIPQPGPGPEDPSWQRTFVIPKVGNKTNVELKIPNIPKEFLKTYWEEPPAKRGHPNPSSAMSGKEAFKAFTGHLVSGAAGNKDDTKASADDLGPGIDDLILFNIESIDARFTDNLGNYWKQVRQNMQTKDPDLVRPRGDFDKPPEGVGWVVEVSGYTFHHKGRTFIKNTLLENIARLGLPQPEGATPAPGTPPAGAPPAGTPLAPPVPPPPPFPGAGGPGNLPGQAAQLPDMGPVINKISHVVLFTDRPSRPDKVFDIIGTNPVDALTKSVAATPGPGGMGVPGMSGSPAAPAPDAAGGPAGPGGMAPMGAPTTLNRDSWTPLIPGLAGQQGPGMPGMGPGMGVPFRPAPP
jgi:type IV pilus assembly protein PilM